MKFAAVLQHISGAIYSKLVYVDETLLNNLILAQQLSILYAASVTSQVSHIGNVMGRPLVYMWVQ